MVPYWIVLTLSLLPFSFRRLSYLAQCAGWFLVWLLFSFFIGLRVEVGGDWNSYVSHLHRVSGQSFFEVFLGGDPGYYLLNWLVSNFGGGIVWVNLICASVTMAGIIRFARSQPLPWLALFVSVPYLVIVVSMGYTRQAVALGFLLVALVDLKAGKFRRFVFWVILGAAFHKSAILMLPIAALSSANNRFWTVLWVGMVSLVGGYFFLFDHVDRLWAGYVEADYESQGGLIRVLMNFVPAMFFLLLKKKMRVEARDARFWHWIAVFSILCVPLVMISSTATDRVALYFIPLQMYVFSRIFLVSDDKYVQSLIVVGVVFYYSLVQFVWLNFASHAHAWLPYQMYPFAS